MAEAIQISITPPEVKSQDFDFLREEGMKLIRAVAADTWSDHNYHDPGISLWEAYCYAITEMGLRTGMQMRDLVASDISGRKQDFFSAGEILPVAPLTIKDFRKVLIDHPLIQNAWLFPLESDPAGKFNVLLEFSDDELNSNEFSFEVTPATGNYNVDLAFPYWDEDEVLLFSEDVTLLSVVFDGPPGNEWTLIEGSDAYFARITINFQPLIGPPQSTLIWIVAQVTTPLDNPLVEMPLILPEITARVISLIDLSPTDLAIVRRFAHRVRDAAHAMRIVRRYLKDYRNLCEDFAEYKAVRLQEIAVSAIIEVNPGIVPESLLADIFFSIDQFIAPVNIFQSLQELLAAETTETIFDGPLSDSGFLLDKKLNNSNFSHIIYTSDILRLILRQRDQRLSDIIEREDVSSRNIAAVRNLSLANYLDNRVITSNARDCLHLVESQRHVPRLSLTKSHIIFYRSGVETSYDLNRVIQIFEEKKAAFLLNQATSSSDLPLPQGEVNPVSDYYPIQNDLPLIYGVGEAGLPDTVSEERKALALQLKGYVFFIEQLTSGLATQMANINSFFSADPDLEQTIFQQPLYHLPQVAEILKSFDPSTTTWTNFKNDLNNGYATALKKSSESREQFLSRRNKVLNHLLAVFGEDMYDTAALAYHKASLVSDSLSLSLTDLINLQNQQRNIASRQLIRQKSAFLKSLPLLNRDRAQSFGNPIWRNDKLILIQEIATGFNWFVLNDDGTTIFRSVVPANSEAAAYRLAAETFSLATIQNNYSIKPDSGQLRLVIKQTPSSTNEIAESSALFVTPALANAGILSAVGTIVQLWFRHALIPLEGRLYHLLGFVLKERRQLVHLVSEFFELFNEPPPIPIKKRFRLWELPGFSGTQLLTSELNYIAASDPAATALANAAIQTVINRGVYIENYSILNPAINVFDVVLSLPDSTIVARSPVSFATRDLATAAMLKIWTHLLRMYSNEGFYLIEHLLLEPKSVAGTELNIPETKQPYSFQISFVFPSGYARDFSDDAIPLQPIQPERYRDAEFRKHAEKQIRKACPAHVLSRILWVDRVMLGSVVPVEDASFNNFEQRYHAWLQAYVADETQEAVIGPLRNELVRSLNNIYIDQLT